MLCTHAATTEFEKRTDAPVSWVDVDGRNILFGGVESLSLELSSSLTSLSFLFLSALLKVAGEM